MAIKYSHEKFQLKSFLKRGIMIKTIAIATFLASKVVPFFTGVNFSFSVTESVAANLPHDARLSC
jgi:hypothetical protein